MKHLQVVAMINDDGGRRAGALGYFLGTEEDTGDTVVGVGDGTGDGWWTTADNLRAVEER